MCLILCVKNFQNHARFSDFGFGRNHEFWMQYSAHGGGRYHIETSPLVCRANQWTDFYMIGTSIMKELYTVAKHSILDVCGSPVYHCGRCFVLMPPRMFF